MLGERFAGATVLKAFVAALGLLTLTVGGAWTLGIVGTPGVTGVNNAFGGVNQSTTVIETNLVVNNPNPIDITLGNLSADYVVEMNGIRMAEGHKEGLEVNKRGNTSVPFRTEMNNSKLPAWWVSHIRNGERTTLTVNASVDSGIFGQSFSPQVKREVNTSLIAAFNSDEDRPIDANKPLVKDPVLWLNRTAGEWGDVNERRTDIEMAFDFHNPKSVPITITKIGYDIRMNGVEMGEGATDKSVVIPSGATRTVTATTVIQNQHLDEWWVTHLENDQVTTLEVEFYAVVDLSAAGGGNIRIPLDTMEQTVETDMFGNKNGSAAAGGGGGSGESTPAPTSTDGSEDGASTDANDDAGTDAKDAGTDSTDDPGKETESGGTATPNPTPTPSPTDDGLVPSVEGDAASVAVGR